MNREIQQNEDKCNLYLALSMQGKKKHSKNLYFNTEQHK